MSEYRMICPRCKAVMIFNTNDRVVDSNDAFYRSTCWRCRRQGIISGLCMEGADQWKE